MAKNISVGYAYEPRVNVMRVYTNKKVDFKQIMLTYLCPRYQ